MRGEPEQKSSMLPKALGPVTHRSRLSIFSNRWGGRDLCQTVGPILSASSGVLPCHHSRLRVVNRQSRSLGDGRDTEIQGGAALRIKKKP